MLSRKQFLQQLATVAAGTSLLGLESTEAYAASAANLTFDLHCHPGLFVTKGTATYAGDEAVVKTLTAMNENRLSGAFFSLVADMPIIAPGPTGINVTRQFAAGEAWKEYKRQLALFKELFLPTSVRVATKTADLESYAKQDKVAAYLGCEGGDFLEGRLDRVNEAYADGVRSIQLVHYAPNNIGDLQTSPAINGGLTTFGKNLVRRMHELGMVVDVAHANTKTVKDVLAVGGRPIILSHSALSLEPTRPLALRTISADHARLIAGVKGVIGMWPSGFFKDFDEFVDGTKRLIDVVGVDHVGLGTDMDGNFKPVIDNYGQLATWGEALQSRGFSADDVKKVLGGNALRVLKATLKG